MSRIYSRVRRVLHRERIAEPLIEEYIEGILDSNTERETERMKDQEIVSDYRLAEPFLEESILERKIS